MFGIDYRLPVHWPVVLRGLALGLLLALPMGTLAEIYKWVDEQGRTHYGQQPPLAAAESATRVKPRENGMPVLDQAGSSKVGAWYRREGRDLLRIRLPYGPDTVQVEALSRAAAARQSLGWIPLCSAYMEPRKSYYLVRIIDVRDARCPWPETTRQVYVRRSGPHKLTLTPGNEPAALWMRAQQRAKDELNPMEQGLLGRWETLEGGPGQRLVLRNGVFSLWDGDWRVADGLWSYGEDFRLDYVTRFAADVSLVGQTQVWQVFSHQGGELVLDSGPRRWRLRHSR